MLSAGFCQPMLSIRPIAEKTNMGVASVLIDQFTETVTICFRVSYYNCKARVIVQDFLKQFARYSRAEIEESRRQFLFTQNQSVLRQAATEYLSYIVKRIQQQTTNLLQFCMTMVLNILPTCYRLCSSDAIQRSSSRLISRVNVCVCICCQAPILTVTIDMPHNKTPKAQLKLLFRSSAEK